MYPTIVIKVASMLSLDVHESMFCGSVAMLLDTVGKTLVLCNGVAYTSKQSFVEDFSPTV
jgi:hypothetical protein